MRGLRIGFGLSLGLFGGLLALSLGQCSFNLDGRTLLSCTDLGCKPDVPGDMKPIPPDMKDPDDPSMNGSYRVATFPLSSQIGVADQTLLGPSDDGTTLSSRQATYPLVVMSPPTMMTVAAMRLYADRLVSHGFIVSIYLPSDQSNDASYRNVGNIHLDAVLTNSDPAIRDHIDATKVGLLGYQLSAKIAVNIAVYRQQPTPNIAGLFLIEPTDLLASNPESGSLNIPNLRLLNGNTVVMLGDPRAASGSPMCIQTPQKTFNDFWNNVQAPALGISFDGANLGDFLPSYPDTVCTQGSTSPQAVTQGLAVKYATAYFQWSLKGSPRARDYLYGADFTADAQSSMLTPRMK